MLKSLSAKLGHVLILYGGWGLFAMSFLDSSLVPFPGVNDLALILMASRRPALWPLYTLASALGSVGGAYLLYATARGGSRVFSRQSTEESRSRARRWLENHDFVAMLTASILPPPAPLKVFILTAGVLRVKALNFGLALLLGRGMRFGAEAWLGARYGPQAEEYIRHNLAWTSLAGVILIVGLALLKQWWSHNHQRSI